MKFVSWGQNTYLAPMTLNDLSTCAQTVSLRICVLVCHPRDLSIYLISFLVSSLHVRLTVIVSPGCFSRLVTDLNARPKVLFLSSCVCLFRSAVVHAEVLLIIGI